MSDEIIETIPAVTSTDEIVSEPVAVTTTAEVPQKRECFGCKKAFGYGDYVFTLKLGDDASILCQKCWNGESEADRRAPGNTISIYVGGIASCVARERAAKRFKKLQREVKAAAKR